MRWCNIVFFFHWTNIAPLDTIANIIRSFSSAICIYWSTGSCCSGLGENRLITPLLFFFSTLAVRH